MRREGNWDAGWEDAVRRATGACQEDKVEVEKKKTAQLKHSRLDKDRRLPKARSDCIRIHLEGMGDLKEATSQADGLCQKSLGRGND